jgi:hypothetical protein
MGFRSWLLTVLAIIAVILAGDWIISTAHLNQIEVEATADPPILVSDGLQKTSITIRITENGKPRVGDLVNIFLITGSGRILPGWAYTDSEGMIVTEFTPNVYTPYDPVEGAEINILDISIGQLVEVGKSKVINIPLIKPTQ